MNGNAKKIAEVIEVKATQLQHVNTCIQNKIKEISDKKAETQA